MQLHSTTVIHWHLLNVQLHQLFCTKPTYVVRRCCRFYFCVPQMQSVVLRVNEYVMLRYVLTICLMTGDRAGRLVLCSVTRARWSKTSSSRRRPGQRERNTRYVLFRLDKTADIVGVPSRDVHKRLSHKTETRPSDETETVKTETTSLVPRISD